MGYEVAVTGPGDRVPSSGPLNGVLFFGTGALDHVDIVAGTDGPGVWLPDYVADAVGCRSRRSGRASIRQSRRAR